MEDTTISTLNLKEDPKKKEEKTLRNVFLETASEWAKSSTSHGIPNIVRTNSNLVRLMWILCFLTSISYCGFTIVNSLIVFFKYETVVQVKVEKELPTEFPAVTICNLNPFYSLSKSAYLDNVLMANNYSLVMNVTSADNLTDAYNNNNNGNDTMSIVDLMEDVLTVMKRSVSTNRSLSDSDRKKFGFSLDDYMLLSCSFNGIACTERNFSWYWDYNYGNCYTFNNGKNSLNESLPIKVISKAGSEYGLKIELIVGDPMLQEYSYKSGVYVVIHNKSDNVKTHGLAGGINVLTGVETYISISRTYRNKEPYPYSNCLNDWNPFSAYSQKIYDIITSANISAKYDQLLCYRMCMQDYIMNNCSCMDPRLPDISDAIYCTNKSQVNCANSIDKMFSDSDTDVICQNACPQQCSSVDYQPISYSANYPTSYYTNLLKTYSNFLKIFAINDTKKLSLLKECILKINLNYHTLSYETINEMPAIPLESLFGTLGGQLGLFIGISFLSMIEIIEIIIEYCILFYKVCTDRKQLKIKPIK